MEEIKLKSVIDIEEAKSILDRIIGFVNSCDNKIAIALGIYGVVVAVVFTDGSISSIKTIISEALKSNNIMYLIIFAFISFVFLFVLSNFIRALIARKDVSIYKDGLSTKESYLFWGDICKRENYQLYHEEIKHISETEYLNDLITQIYFNSKICTIKHKYYNQGIIVTTIGFFLLIAVWIVGIIIF